MFTASEEIFTDNRILFSKNMKGIPFFIWSLSLASSLGVLKFFSGFQVDARYKPYTDLAAMDILMEYVG